MIVPAQERRTKRLTAFVLAGGGSLGAVQVGMLKALVRHRVIPDLVVGASWAACWESWASAITCSRHGRSEG